MPVCQQSAEWKPRCNRLTKYVIHACQPERTGDCALFQFVGDFVDPSLSAHRILLAARRTGDTDRAHHIDPHLDRQRTLDGNYVVYVNREITWIVFETFGDLA